ncbi:MAG: CDP-alcohol phosphatidyltransferase family protein [Flavobacteriales bacterium]
MRNKNDIRNFVNLPDYISLGNLLFGCISIFSALQGFHFIAALCIVVSAIFDLFDGRVARKLNLSSEFGLQLDSLADAISFIMAPVIFAYAVSNKHWLILLILSLYVCCGILRLARYNITGTIENGKYFEGVPVPVSLILPLLYFVFEHFDLPILVWMSLFAVHALLMISTLRIKKL